MHLITEMESAFREGFFHEEAKVRFVVNLLCGGAKDWWGKIIHTISSVKQEATS